MTGKIARALSALAVGMMTLGGLPLLLSSTARSNDGVAVLETDGIRLARTDKVKIAEETLFISPTRVRVRYRYQVIGKEPFDTIVAFPLPAISMGEDTNISLPSTGTIGNPDVVGFHVWVNGREIRPRIEARATLNGLDVTNVLKKHGLPVVVPEPPAAWEAFMNTLRNLSPQARRELEMHGLVTWSPPLRPGGQGAPEWNWRAHVTYYWRQHFPPGRDTIIEHEYQPIAGEFFMPNPREEKWMRKAYCTDAAFERAAEKLLSHQGTTPLLAHQVHYILETADTWAGPIGRFHLIIEKQPPYRLVSLCWDGKIRKTSPTRFESVIRDFEPRGKLKVLFLREPETDDETEQ